ncbi:MAG TPA: RNA methyltransferase [Thermomicrobiales bacterium]|nr:RNA methyltransferase [Thermomicrobiales bacterium]
MTPRRLARMRGTLSRRQPDLTVVIENVHDPHNVSAMLRTCDAVGAASAHLVYDEIEAPIIHLGVSASAQRWLELVQHEAIVDCYEALRKRGFAIYATTLGDASRELFELDLTQPTAFVFGNETRGVSASASEGADASVFIPMMGMVESLNVSVACAVSLYEALRQRRAAGRYDRSSYPPAELDTRLRDWLEREGRNPAVLETPPVDETPKARSRYIHRP